MMATVRSPRHRRNKRKGRDKMLDPEYVLSKPNRLFYSLYFALRVSEFKLRGATLRIWNPPPGH